MTEVTKFASVYIVVITVAFVVIFYAWLRQREMLRKNKCKYDLRLIKQEMEPLGDDTWRLNFYCGKLLHSQVVSETDIFLDKGFLYKAFIKWCEEDSK